MTNAIIAIKGDHWNNQDTIFEAFKYEDLKQDKLFDNLDKAGEYLFNNYFNFSEKDIALCGIWIDNGWTMLLDPEMVNVLDDEALVNISSKLNAPVHTFIIQTTSNSFAFASYNQIKQRQFMSIEGNITEDTGTPMSEESGLNINNQIFVDDILKLANKIGIDMEGKNAKAFTVKQLGYNEELKMQLNSFQTVQPQRSKKAWWKFW
jgi:hypothetical protein